jgi:rare lipoprotein A
MDIMKIRTCLPGAIALACAFASPSSAETGIASVYWQPQPLACGGRLDVRSLTAAHKRLPCGTKVRVHHAGTGRSVVVRIRDRGPYIRGRVIDLTPAAARAIGMPMGLAKVRLEIIGR